VEAGMEALIQVVTRVRALRAEMGLSPKAKLDLHLQPAEAADAGIGRLLAEQAPLLRFLTRVETVALGAVPEGARRDLVAGVEIGLQQAAVEKSEMSAEERGRLEKELEKLETEISRAGERLSNADFLAKAPAKVVEGGRAKLAEMRERQASLRSSLGMV
jgi:valyl-tRNA synthetase